MSLNFDTNGLWPFLTLMYKDHPVLVMILTFVIIIIFFVILILWFIKRYKKQSDISNIERYTKSISDHFKLEDSKNEKK